MHGPFNKKQLSQVTKSENIYVESCYVLPVDTVCLYDENELCFVFSYDGKLNMSIWIYMNELVLCKTLFFKFLVSYSILMALQYFFATQLVTIRGNPDDCSMANMQIHKLMRDETDESLRR